MCCRGKEIGASHSVPSKNWIFSLHTPSTRSPLELFSSFLLLLFSLFCSPRSLFFSLAHRHKPLFSILCSVSVRTSVFLPPCLAKLVVCISIDRRRGGGVSPPPRAASVKHGSARYTQRKRRKLKREKGRVGLLFLLLIF